MLDFIQDIRDSAGRAWTYLNDPEAYDKQEELKAMRICAEAIDPLWPAARGKGEANWRNKASDPQRKVELERIAEVCSHVPGTRAQRFLGGAAILLVRPPGRDHRTESLGRLQPGQAGPAPVSLLSARPGGRHSDPTSRRRSCCNASGSSSTTSRRRPRWASLRRRAAPTPILPRSTWAG